jgi:hypothetical protein
MAQSNAAAIPRLRTFRLIRQLHLWMGAWGAIGAILFGFTGFVQNHRAVWKLPQGDSTEVSSVEMTVPEGVGETPDLLRTWLRVEQHVILDNQRVKPGGLVEFNGQKIRQPAHWTFIGGNARKLIQAEYNVGAPTLTLRATKQSPLAVLTRLHKGVGGGIPWILLVDSFALAMMALGISGLVLWARGRSLRQMTFSIVGVAVVLLVAIGAGAVI